MHTVQTLIDEAINVCTSQSALARRLGITPGDVHEMAKGKRPISPATVAMLCDVLQLPGEEAQRLAAEAIIATAKPEKQGVLRRAFFALSATGEKSGAAADQPIHSGKKPSTTKATRYTLSRLDLRSVWACLLPSADAVNAREVLTAKIKSNAAGSMMVPLLRAMGT